VHAHASSVYPNKRQGNPILCVHQALAGSPTGRYPASMRLHLRLLPLLLATLTLSCYMGQATVDEPLDAAAIAQLQPRTSTAEDVTRLLGAPNQVVELGTGSAWLYQAQTGKQMGVWLLIFGAFGQDTRSDRCWVFFDQTGTLTHVGATLSADQAEYHLSGS